MIAWYVLPPVAAICLDCLLPRCNENDPRCPWRLARVAGKGSRKKPAPRVRQVLAYLGEHLGMWYRIKDVADAVGAPYSSVVGVVVKLRHEGRIEHKGSGHTLRLRALAGDLN